MGAAPVTTANVAVDSVYYSYVDKLSGMGYIKSLPNGAKPYSRMEMAKWASEAEEVAKDRPMPAYLQDMLQAMEKEFAPEIATWQGTRTYDGLRLHSVTATLAVQGGDSRKYRYAQVNGSWQPFGANRNGYTYGKNGNAILTAEVSGNIGHDTAISLRPRISYDKDNKLSMSLEEGYIKTRSGIWAFEFGKQAMRWGEGVTGNLALGNNMTPLTAIQVHFMEPQRVGGFFRFLGEADFHAFYGKLEGDRADRAAAYGRTDYDDAGLLGLRVDITPRPYFTLGLSRLSLMGGNGNGLNHSDWKDWLTGKNAYSGDRWDDIAGYDFRLRLPGVQFYGEYYGEDQAGHLPSDMAYRFGVYFPRLTKDGAWDMTLEAAGTNSDWYRHGRFQDGWTYGGDIMGDSMGTDARKYYLGIRHYLPREGNVGVYYLRTDRERNLTNHATTDEIGLTGQKRLSNNVYLNATLGYAKVSNANFGTNTDHDWFAGASMRWVY
jgi:hypothetical protein